MYQIRNINAGKYKKVSVELYRNLEGKGAYLKAVSFLGAAIPQVKGLETIKFMEAEADTFEFEEESDNNVEQFSQEEIDNLKNQITDLENQLVAFKDSNKKLETIKSLKEKISALTEAVSAFKEKANEIKQEELEKFANADEESLEIFKEAKALAQKENISFKDALLKLNK